MRTIPEVPAVIFYILGAAAVFTQATNVLLFLVLIVLLTKE